MTFQDAIRQGAIGLASTVIVAMGAGVITSARTNAVQDQQITVIQTNEQALDTTLKQLSTDVQQLNVNVAVLNERLKNGQR